MKTRASLNLKVVSLLIGQLLVTSVNPASTLFTINMPCQGRSLTSFEGTQNIAAYCNGSETIVYYIDFPMLTENIIFSDFSNGFYHYATSKGTSVYAPNNAGYTQVKKQKFSSDFTSKTEYQSSAWYADIRKIQCAAETTYCYTGSTTLTKAYRINDLNFDTEAPFEYNMSWIITFIAVQKVTGLVCGTPHFDVNFRLQVFDPTITNGSHLLFN